MKLKHLILVALLVLTLALTLSGCSGGSDDLEGKYIATFEMNGGTLDISTSNVSTRINYAYEPGVHIIDPSSYANYEIVRQGYRFTGWYKTAECLEADRWDFATDTIDTERLTLYAGWIKEIVYTFSVGYTDGDSTVTLGSYNVSAGAKFEDYRKYADKRDGFTANGYYADAECTTPWSFDTAHPGGETDTDITVYVDYIEGEWKLVDSYDKLLDAIGEGNIYLTDNINCGGGELSFGSFNHILEGNGFVISNFKVVQSSSAVYPVCSIFTTLGSGSEVRNVAFDEVTFSLFGVESAREVRVAALARDAADDTVVITAVSVTGKIITDYQGELSRLNKAFFNTDTFGAEEDGLDFTANLTVEQQS